MRRLARSVTAVTVLFAVLAPPLAPGAGAFQKPGTQVKGCLECHALTREEAAAALGGLVDNVVGVVPGPFPGLWEVDVTKGGRTYPLYMDYSRKYLLNGQFIRLYDMENLTGTRSRDLNRVDVSSISVKDAIVVGSRKAKRRVIVLSDPTCPYCVKLHGEMKKAVEKDPDTAYLVMPYPRNRNDKAAYRTCLSVVCGKTVKHLDDAYSGKALPPPSCRSRAVDETIRLADRLQVQGTPSMILPDGRLVSGYMDADALLALLKSGR